MKHALRYCLALACCGLLPVAISPAAQAEFKCNRTPLTRVDATACALGAQDVASLRRYVARTRMIYSLYMNDYVRFAGDAATTRPASGAQVNAGNSLAGVSPPTRLGVEGAQLR